MNLIGCWTIPYLSTDVPSQRYDFIHEKGYQGNNNTFK